MFLGDQSERRVSQTRQLRRSSSVNVSIGNIRENRPRCRNGCETFLDGDGGDPTFLMVLPDKRIGRVCAACRKLLSM